MKNNKNNASSTEFAQYYQRKRFELLSQQGKEVPEESTDNLSLAEEMNKLICCTANTEKVKNDN